MTNPVPYPIESVDNALRLVLLLRERGEVGVTEAARYLGVAPSTAHRLVSMLVHHGFAEQNSRRAYVPGPAAPPPGPPRSRVSDLRETVRPHLERLSEALQETVHFVVLRGTAVHFIDGVEFPQSVLVASRAGMTLPAHCTAAGKAILASLRPSEIAALYPRGLPVVYGPGPTKLSALTRQLAGVRRAGFSVNGEESERGIVGVGVCIREATGQVQTAIAAGIPTTRCPNDRVPTVARKLQSAVIELTSELEEISAGTSSA